MQISNFEETGLDKIKSWIKENNININELDRTAIKEALKTVNISFVAEEINRIQSTLLCELKDSYVQQSQRYVSLAEDAYQLPDLSTADNAQAQSLLEQSFKLYEKMSQLKEGEFKGRPKIEHYKYGIPIEDARYILPLATKTNISVAMTGNKLYDLFSLFFDQQYDAIFKEMREEMINLLPDTIVQLLPTTKNNNYNQDVVAELYQEDFAQLNSENKMILVSNFDNLDLKVGLGAATSTSAKTPSAKLKEWGAEAKKKAQSLTERVLGYGHESIAEQARTTFAMMCSMVTYHQQIRHRLSENYREGLEKLILEGRTPLVPPTIKDSQFEEEFLDLAAQIKEFRMDIYREYGLDKALPFLLNCDQIKLIMSTNARIDQEMLAERICFNAQWEIRELSTKKLLELRNLSSILYEKALPSCVYGTCKEGKLSCGQQQEMRSRFLE
ncbi:MAG: FAD-dependent thymidylate synthase [Bacillota bacterium]